MYSFTIKIFSFSADKKKLTYFCTVLVGLNLGLKIESVQLKLYIEFSLSLNSQKSRLRYCKTIFANIIFDLLCKHLKE